MLNSIYIYIYIYIYIIYNILEYIVYAQYIRTKIRKL